MLMLFMLMAGVSHGSKGSTSACEGVADGQHVLIRVVIGAVNAEVSTMVSCSISVGHIMLMVLYM